MVVDWRTDQPALWLTSKKSHNVIDLPVLKWMKNDNGKTSYISMINLMFCGTNSNRGFVLSALYNKLTWNLFRSTSVFSFLARLFHGWSVPRKREINSNIIFELERENCNYVHLLQSGFLSATDYINYIHIISSIFRFIQKAVSISFLKNIMKDKALLLVKKSMLCTRLRKWWGGSRGVKGRCRGLTAISQWLQKANRTNL